MEITFAHTAATNLKLLDTAIIAPFSLLLLMAITLITVSYMKRWVGLRWHREGISIPDNFLVMKMWKHGLSRKTTGLGLGAKT